MSQFMKALTFSYDDGVTTDERLIEIFTDPGDVVIDPCFGSGSTARAAVELGRNFYGFEINKEFYRRAKEEMLKFPEEQQLSIFDMSGVAND